MVFAAIATVVGVAGVANAPAIATLLVLGAAVDTIVKLRVI